jgi:hypothetical protein
MKIPHRFLLIAGLALASPGLLAAAPADTSPDHKAATDAIHKTVTDTRNVGTAMWLWYKDNVEPRRSEDSHRKATEESKTKSVDFASVPVISREELAKLLVPKYIAGIPELDGWGHPYEFRLNTQDPNAIRVMAVRSGGRDGRFSGDVYEISSFPPTDLDQDIVWIDGYFARWPAKAKQPG